MRFFFSSRRRHTRSKRDWSSDVALPIYRQRLARASIRCVYKPPPPEKVTHARERVQAKTLQFSRKTSWRSEERRVGKERRARWLAVDRQKRTAAQETKKKHAKIARLLKL